MRQNRELNRRCYSAMMDALEPRLLMASSPYAFIEFYNEDVLRPTFTGLEGVAASADGDEVYVNYGFLQTPFFEEQRIGTWSPEQPILTPPLRSAVENTSPATFYMTRVDDGEHLGLQSGDLLVVTGIGQVRWFRPSDAAKGSLFNIRALPFIDNTHLWDPATRTINALGGTVQPAISIYGDVAVHETEDHADILVAGASGPVPFLMRIRLVNGAVQSAKVLVGSGNNGSGGHPRGLAVNQDGTVLTTLPVPPASNPTAPGPDRLVSFNADFDDGGQNPSIYNEGAGIISRGMDSDSRGNFVIATDLGGYVKVSRNFVRVQPFAADAPVNTVAPDIAATDTHVYMGVSSAFIHEVWRMPYAPFLPPSSPTGLSANAVSTTQINLSWSDKSNDETGFRIEQSTSADFSNPVVTNIPANSTSQNATGLSPGTTYYFRVYAYNDVGDSSNPSSASAATQPAPANNIVSGIVFRDLDANGVKNGSETGDFLRLVYSDANNDGAHQTGETFAITNSSGEYTLSGLANGAHRIRLAPYNNWTTTAPAGGYFDELFSTGTGHVTGRNFATAQFGSVIGTVYQDSNSNGARDGGEAGLAGWRVYLDTQQNSRWDTGERFMLTDASGNFTFDNLQPGVRHPMHVEARDNWTQCQPGSSFSTFYDLQPVSGTAYVNAHYGVVYRPFRGAPAALPGKIEAEDFDKGPANGVYRDLASGDNGAGYRITPVHILAVLTGSTERKVGATQAGEWLEYTIHVPSTGAYTMELSVSNIASGGQFHVEFNGVNKTGAMVVPNTGGWSNYQVVSRTVQLEAGTQVMRLAMDTTGGSGWVGDFDWISFAAAAPPRLNDRRFDFDTAQRALRFVFDKDVSASLSASDLTVTRLADQSTVSGISAPSYDGASNTARFGLPELPDGNYRAILRASGVTDANGAPLAEDAVLDFFVLDGDVDRDRSVTFADLLAVAANFGRTSATFAQGDNDRDGTVSFADLLKVSSRFGSGLPGAAAAAAPAQTMRVSPNKTLFHSGAVIARAARKPVARR